MALVTKSFSVDVTPGAIPSVVHVSQYDVGREYNVTLLDENGNSFTIPQGTSAVIQGTIGRYGFEENADIENNEVVFELTESMTANKGSVWVKIKLTLNNAPISTCAFILDVDKAGVEASTVVNAEGFDDQIQDAVYDYLDEYGQDAVSPQVTITTIPGGHRVTITDSEHPNGQSFDVMDGSSASDTLLVVHYNANNDTFDSTYSAITAALTDGKTVLCEIACGNSVFYAPLKRDMPNGQYQGENFYSFDYETYATGAAYPLWYGHLEVSDEDVVTYTEGYIRNPEASTTIPQMDGAGSYGASDSYARADHRHPSDTTKVSINAQSLTDPQKAQARTNINAQAVVTRETVSGSSATLDAEVDTLYLCGEMTALTIDTFPQTGIFSVVFTSGATATVLTVPQTLIMPDSFAVEANKRYEVNVMDGYAVVAEWAVSAS